MKPLNPKDVRSCFDYDWATGNLIWAKRNSRRINVGDVAGFMNNIGYTVVGFNGHPYLAHHLVWAWHHGDLPVGDVDHINRNRSDNRIENLRCVTRTENLLNARHVNSTGYPGVMRVASGRYVAGIHINRKRFHLGTFDTPESAFERYAEEHAKLYGEMSRFHPDHVNPLVDIKPELHKKNKKGVVCVTC